MGGEKVITVRALRSTPVLTFALFSVVAACGGSSGPAAPTPSATTTTPVPTTTSAAPTPSTTAVSAYLMSGEHVQPVARMAHGTGVAAEAVRGLLAGPTATERAGGLSTAVPAGTTLLGVTIRDGLATVDLSGAFGSGGGSLSMTSRVAQVVFTLTQFPTVQRVSFRLDGKDVAALGGEGVDVSDVTRADYESRSAAVLVERPLWGASVSSPLRVTGTADVFEAVFFLELRDSADHVLVTQREMATSGTGTRGTFDATLTFSAPAAGAGTLVAFTRSPKDGTRHDEVSVPVRLAG
jgi:hypothetical protein